MIQTLGDVFMLVGIVAVGVISFLLAIFLYNAVFIAMDLRKVMKRLNELSEQIEEMVSRPVELVSEIVDWLQKKVWEAYFTGGTGESRKDRRAKKRELKKEKKRRKKSGGFERTAV